jgi:hypothetical protein
MVIGQASTPPNQLRVRNILWQLRSADKHTGSHTYDQSRPILRTVRLDVLREWDDVGIAGRLTGHELQGTPA